MEIEVKKGQYWVENNPKYEGQRIVEVTDVREDLVRIKTIVQKIGGKAPKGYIRWAHKERFNGKSGGYSLLQTGVEQ